MLGIFSTGDVIAIAVAAIANVVTVGVTVFVQRRESGRTREAEFWRRSTERRRRVHSSFASALLSAGQLQGMTDITNWKRDESLSESELTDLSETLRRIQADLQAAVVNLTLEGIKEPVEMIGEMYRSFGEFRRGLARMDKRREPPNLVQEMIEHKESIDRIRERLEADLPAILNSIAPDQPLRVRRRLRWWTP